MRIQFKLFLLLLVIAILPLAALSWRSERATENLGQAIFEHGKIAMVEEIEAQLRQAVSSSSDLLAAQQRQVALALRLQAAEIERLLTLPPSRAVNARDSIDGDLPPPRAVNARDSIDGGLPPPEEPQVYLHSAFDTPANWPPGTELALDHAVTLPGRELQAVPISRDYQSFLPLPDLEAERARELMRRLAPLDAVYRKLSESSPRLFYWQFVALKEGLHSVYPGHGGYPANYDPRQRNWYTSAAASDDVVWTQPGLDASTRRLVLTAALKLKGADGSFAGVTGIDIDLLGILTTMQARLRLGASAEGYIVQLSDAQGKIYAAGDTSRDAQGAAGLYPQLRVLASSTYHDSGTSWDSVPETPVLKSGTPTGLDEIVRDLLSSRAGMRQMPHKGREALWVYGPVEGLRAGLLFIVPADEIEVIADQAQQSVREAIVDQVRLAGIATVALTILVAALSMIAARSVTGPLRELAAAAQGLARGDLDSRADVQGSDEVADLARSFNAMVPELRQHIQVKESLTLAREVQQKLLPETAPVVPGFDIAGFSVYSEDVGGDYYDFMELTDEAGERRIGISVGDVAGHGIVAALTMTSVRVLLRSHAGDGTVLKPVIRAVNRHLAADAAAGRFVTLAYLVLEPDTREIRWINAGHGPLFLFDPVADTFEEMTAQDIPLGVNADWRFEEQVRSKWPSSGILIIGTDGIWEAKNPEGRQFGNDGLKQVIRKNQNLSAADICMALVERLTAFMNGEPQRDDITLVVIKFPKS